jgi:SSS family solute:Na+ symporter
MLAIALYSRGHGELALPVDARGAPDYNLVVPVMLAKYFPNGLLGIGLTALMASFMSGMAGNVTAFNTVWTYDLYQGHLNPGASDEHLVKVGRLTTVVGLAISGACAYLAAGFNNIMDLLQLVFGFVNAPLFAIFLLGMFWKRATGHGAFYGLLLGTLTAMLFHGCTLPAGEAAGIKGGWLALQHTFASPMAQTFWMAIFAFTGCFLGTLAISLATTPNRAESELRGLVYSLTDKPADMAGAAWYARPVPLGVAILGVTALLNLIFW